MATLQLQVEVDSDVHPELYAALAAVARAGLRPERLRQLAASGLIWEHLRGKPRIEPVALAEPAPREGPPVLRDVVQMPVQSERRAAPRIEPAPAPEPEPEVPPAPESVEMDDAPEIELIGLEPQPAAAAGEGGAAARRARLLRMKASGLFNNG